MAYLKGGSVVDGNLYIEGGLIVRNISTNTGGQLPTLDDGDTKSDRLVKFKNNNGGLRYSSFGETVSTVSDTDTGKPKKGVNLYVGETKDEFNSLGVSFGRTNTTDNHAEVFTITNINNTEGDNTIEIAIHTSASKISVEEKNNIIDENGKSIDIGSFNVTTDSIPESFSYSEN